MKRPFWHFLLCSTSKKAQYIPSLYYITLNGPRHYFLVIMSKTIWLDLHVISIGTISELPTILTANFFFRWDTLTYVQCCCYNAGNPSHIFFSNGVSMRACHGDNIKNILYYTIKVLSSRIGFQSVGENAGPKNLASVELQVWAAALIFQSQAFFRIH